MIAKRLNQMRKLAKVLCNSRYRTALRRAGVAAATEHESLLKTLQFKTVVDIGANRGQFTLVARHCFPMARVIAFEPLAAAASRFRVALGSDPHVCLHPVAIGPATGTATMHVSAADDSSSLLPITDLQQTLFSGTQEIRRQTIQVERLTSLVKDSDLQTPALLKIDVQGFELSVLQGCEDLLDRFSHVYVECSFVELYAGQALGAEVIAFLSQRGFDLRGVYNVQYDPAGSAIQADMMFELRKSSPINQPPRQTP